MLPVVIGTIVLLLQPQAHPATPPKFEVASIRPCRETEKGAGGRGRKKGGLRSDPGNLHIGCETIERLIQFAWLGYPEGKPWTTPGLSGLPEPPIPFTRMFQPIEGAPSWAQSEKYTIDAKPEQPESMEMMRGPMMRQLLQERLKLEVRLEPGELTVYALTVAKGGSHLRPAQGGNCAAVTFDPSAVPGLRASSNLPGCGFFGPDPDGRVRTLGQTMAGLSVQISAWLDQEIVDRTGIEGLYDIVLEMPASDFMPHRADAAAAPEPPRDRFGEVARALAGLGLKLDRTHIQTGKLAIGHIERPSEN